VRPRDASPPEQHAEGNDGRCRGPHPRDDSGRRGRRGEDGANPQALRPGYTAPASAGRSGGVTPRDGDVMRITNPAAIRQSSPAPMKAP
jgi:hypothetical protein